MNEQTVRFRLGVFIMGTLMLLAVLIILFGGTPTFLQPSNRYTVTFDDAGGITAGTPVRRSGVRIGEVESLQLDNATGKVNVVIRVDSKYALPKSETPTVVTGFLAGDANIDFLPEEPEPGKKADQTPIKPGATIKGKAQLEAKELVQKAGKVMQPTEEAMKEATKFFKKMDKIAPVIEATLKEYRDLAKVIQKLAPEVGKTNEEIQKLAQDTRKAVPELMKTNEEIQKLAKTTREAIPDIQKTNTEIQNLVKATRDAIPDMKKTNDQIQVTVRSWGRVGERLDVLLQTNEKKLVDSVAKLDKALTQLNKVFSDANVQNLNTTLRNAAESSKKLEGIARNTENLLNESQKTVGKIGDATDSADRVFKNLEKVTKPMAERSETILKNLDEATAQLNSAAIEVRTLMRQVSRSEGTVQKLLTDPSLYNRLDAAACGINRMLPRVDQILRDVEIFADRIARHPEALGISGVVRPSSGLKNLPGRPIMSPNR